MRQQANDTRLPEAALAALISTGEPSGMVTADDVQGRWASRAAP